MMRTPRRRVARAVAPAIAAAIAVTTVAGCGQGNVTIYDLPLPGGADLGDHPYTVTADFASVLDLVPKAAVKVNDVAVGRVQKISLPHGNWHARVTMLVNGRVKLPANAYAHLEQSSLLGEKYIQLMPPSDGGGHGRLTDGASIPLARTNRNPEVEEVFGALSLLLNGGGLNRIHTITIELNKALHGNEPEVRSVISRLDTLVSSLNGHRKNITDALDALDRLSATLAARKEQIGTVLDDLGPGLKVLDQQRGALVTMLKSLDRLSDVAVDTVKKSKADMVADLKALRPILKKLADAGSSLPKALEVLVTYPFTDEVLKGIKGDYLNVYLSVAAEPGTEIIPPLIPDTPPPTSAAKANKAERHAAPLPLPTVGSPTTLPTGGSPSATSPAGGGLGGTSGTSPGGAPSGSTSPGTPSGGSPSPTGTGGEG